MQQSRTGPAHTGGQVEIGYYDASSADSLFLSVVETAARLTDVDEYEFPPLEESVDLESLERFIHATERNMTPTRGFVEFEHDDLCIQIHLNGIIYAERQ